MDMVFSVGDVVYLKSGSPDMTVTYTDNDAVRCVWFVEEVEVKHYSFPSDALAKQQ
jgi:uncharacterized protein YodC (DUF2158 family)